MPTSRIWTSWLEIFPPSGSDRDLAQNLLSQWRQKGFLHKTSLELLNLPDAALCLFFSELEKTGSTEGPFRALGHSGWLAGADTTFYNVRASGTGRAHGNFIQAAKLLLGDRNQAIHLGPFTRYDHGTIYAVVSVKTPSPDVWHPALVQQEVLPSVQIKAFVQAAHLLGKAVGFDLEPHVSQYSYPVLETPEAFRWVKVYTPDPRWLDYLYTPETVYSRESQERIVHEIKVMMTEFFSQESLRTFDEEPGDTYQDLLRKHESFHRGVNLLIRTGYWPVPAHSWNGFGLPRFKGYNNQHQYAEFSYNDRSGKDTGNEAYHIVTPFHFWHGMPVQNTWNWENLARSGEPNHPGIELYRGIFQYWRDEIGFDFIRFDSVDHIWDSCDPQNPAVPFSDRPTPAILRDCILAARSGGRADIGALAERMGSEIRAYETIGFDTMLGSSMLEDPGLQMWHHDLKITEDLEDLNQERAQPFSVCAVLDTHDTGNAFLRGQPLIDIEGPDGILLRLFMARYLYGGAFHRPLYSVMGLTDLSSGLFESNVSPKNLTWRGNTEFLEIYHRSEDLAAEWKLFLPRSEREIRFASPEGAEWSWKNREKELVCRLSFPGTDDPIFPEPPAGAEGLYRLPGKNWESGHVNTLPALGTALFWRKIV